MSDTEGRIARAVLFVVAFFVGMGAAYIPLISYGPPAAWFVFGAFYVGSYWFMKRELLGDDEPPEVDEKIAELNGE